jgi:hypothetical protein
MVQRDLLTDTAIAAYAKPSMDARLGEAVGRGFESFAKNYGTGVTRQREFDLRRDLQRQQAEAQALREARGLASQKELAKFKYDMEEPERDFQKQVVEYKAIADDEAKQRRDRLDKLREEGRKTAEQNRLLGTQIKQTKENREFEKIQKTEYAKGITFDVFVEGLGMEGDPYEAQTIFVQMPKVVKEAVNMILPRVVKNKDGSYSLPDQTRAKALGFFRKFADSIKDKARREEKREQSESEQKILTAKAKRLEAKGKSVEKAQQEARKDQDQLRKNAAVVKTQLSGPVKRLGDIHALVINDGVNSITGKQIIPEEMGSKTERERLLRDPIYLALKKDNKGAALFKAQGILTSMHGMNKMHTFESLEKLSMSHNYKKYYGEINYNADARSLGSVFWLNPNQKTRDAYRNVSDPNIDKEIKRILPKADETLAKNVISLLQELQSTFPGELAHTVLDALLIPGAEGLWGDRTIQEVLDLYPEYTQRTELAAPMTRTSTLPQVRTSTLPQTITSTTGE